MDMFWYDLLGNVLEGFEQRHMFELFFCNFECLQKWLFKY